MNPSGVGGFVSPASFWEPEYVDARSAWLEHAPFAFWLVEAVRPRVIVELGTYTGYSYLSFCQAVARLGLPSRAFAVDTWKGDRHTGAYGPDVLAELVAYHDPRYSSFSRLVPSTFDEAASHFEDDSIDLLHLDGAHGYDAVKHDVETWEPKLSSRAVVLFHDTNVREQGFGVHRLWAELRRKHPGFEFLHGHGLGVLAVGKALPEEVQALVDAEADAALAAEIREVHARLGYAIRRPLAAAAEHELELEALKEALANANGELETLRAELAEAGAHRQDLQTALDAAEVKRAEVEFALADSDGKRLELALADADQKRLEQASDLHDELADSARDRDGLRQELTTARAGLETSEAEVVRLRAEFESVVGSESWRITAPLRSLTRSTGRVVIGMRRLVRLRSRLRALRTRTRSSGNEARLPELPTSISPLDRLLASVGRQPAFFELEGEADVPPPIRDTAIVATADAWAARNGVAAPVAPLARPLISILLPTFNTPNGLLELAVASVLRQTYTNWELIVVDDGSTTRGFTRRLDWVAAQDPRIRVVRNDVNRGISHATNAALAVTRGTFVAMLDHDDELLPDALLRVVQWIERAPDVDVVYTDQEYIDLDGRPDGVLLKPDWSPTLFCGVMFVGHLLVVRRSVAEAVGGFDPAFDNVQDFEFMLRVSERTSRIVHIPEVLYRWRRVPGSVAFHGDEKQSINDLQAKAVTAHLERRGVPASAQPNERHAHRAEFVIRAEPSASVAVIVWLGHDEHVAATLRGLAGSCGSLISTIVTADDDASLSMLEGVDEDFVLSLEPGLVPECAGWLAHLLLHGGQPGIGTVTSVIVDSAGRVDESGLVLGLNGDFGPAMRGWKATSDGYAGSLCCSREVSAVSGRCTLIARERLRALRGPRHLYSGRLSSWIDVALNARSEGLRNIVSSQSVMTRFLPAAAPELRVDPLDAALLRERWATHFAAPDPYHNPHFARTRGGYRLEAELPEVEPAFAGRVE